MSHTAPFTPSYLYDYVFWKRKYLSYFVILSKAQLQTLFFTYNTTRARFDTLITITRYRQISCHGSTPGQIRTFQPQQHKYTLLELVLPRLLAPDLPSNCLDFNFYYKFIPRFKQLCMIVVHPLTTLLYQHWVIFVPVALRGSGSHVKGSLSGIEPLFPVSVYVYGSHWLHHRTDSSVIRSLRWYHRRLITTLQYPVLYICATLHLPKV